MRMSNNSENETLNMIDRKEFRKRQKAFRAKHAEHFAQTMNFVRERNPSFGEIIERNAIKYADNIAVKFEDIQLTYKEFNEWANRYAHYFISLGLKRGDVIEVIMRNRPEMMFIIAAVAKLGVSGSLINPDLRRKSLIHSLKTTPGKIIIVDEECFNMFDDVKSDLQLSADQKLHFSPDRGKISCPEGYINLAEAVSDFPIDNPPGTADITIDDNLLFIFTSGTTGLPKASYCPHLKLVTPGIMIGAIHAEMTQDDTMYVTTPLFHSNALNIGYGGVFGVGATMALARKFSVSRFWDDIRKYKATIFNYIGELCRYLYNQPPKPNDSDNSVKTIIGNGLRPEIWMEFKKRFGIERVAEMYGTTEHGVAFLNLLNFDKTCGFSNSQFAIVKYDVENEEIVRDENGFMQRVGKGGTGLLIIKRESDYSFTGYTDKKETEKKIFRNVFKKGDIWVDMGDLVRDQGSNHIIFVDRLGDTFRWKGQNVSTTEVEMIFNSFNQVEISSVYGVHIPGTDGRAGMASITLKGDIDEFDLDGLSKVLVENLPPYAIPIFLRIKSALSVTSTFKLLKSTLKKEEFNINTIADALYVMMPRESIYTPLTKEIYENIQNDEVKF